MKQAYIVIRTDGSTILLFDYKRARGIGKHFGWPVKKITEQEAMEHMLTTLKTAQVTWFNEK